MNTRLFLTGIVIAVSAACSQSTVDRAAEGAALLAPFKANLKAALVEGMETGPIDAIGACKFEAPRIAAGLSVDGVVMGRSSHKLRNPENVAPDWVAPLIESYLTSSDAELPVVSVELGDGRYGYVEPIMAQPMCLNCHGETLQEPVAARIAELYPDDQATGFKAGDLRGVFWVEF